jgi:hypothetical protein
MLRLRLEYFENKKSEQGYDREENMQTWLHVVVDDSTHSSQLVKLLATRLGEDED